MAISVSCCINLPPPQSNPSNSHQSLQSKTSLLAWPQSQKQRSWKSQCILGVATIIVGLELVNYNMEINEQQIALAWDLQQETAVASKPLMRVQRWSDKRICPPWRVNSLETIVPENLPRPYARRRWEAADHFPEDKSSQPAAQLTTKFATVPNKCFSL